jgi:hypothetical protein
MKNLLAGYINKTIEKEFSKRMPIAGQNLPIGYNPLEVIRGGLFHWILVPFNGIDVLCQLRCSNATQIEQCGDFSNIIAPLKESEGKIMTYEQVIAIRNYQEKLCELSFNIPKYNEICAIVNKNDFVISEKKEELAILENKIDNETNLTDTQKRELQERINFINTTIGFLLPDDTMAFITKWAMGNDISQVKNLTKDQFLRAASLAKTHNKAPSDYLSGVFTDFNKNEIDSFAFLVLDEFQKDQEIVRDSKMNWFLGGRKKRFSEGVRHG